MLGSSLQGFKTPLLIQSKKTLSLSTKREDGAVVDGNGPLTTGMFPSLLREAESFWYDFLAKELEEVFDDETGAIVVIKQAIAGRSAGSISKMTPSALGADSSTGSSVLISACAGSAVISAVIAAELTEILCGRTFGARCGLVLLITVVLEEPQPMINRSRDMITVLVGRL